MNGLVRQYLLKGPDLSGYSQEPLDAIADEIENRPKEGLERPITFGGLHRTAVEFPAALHPH